MKANRYISHHVLPLALLLASRWLVVGAADAPPAGTELVSDGRLVFRASTRVTFGATYTRNAVKATVASKTPADLLIHTGRRPKNVFIGHTRLTDDKWAFDTKAETVSVTIPAGTHDLQLRFDDTMDLAPFKRDVPVVACDGSWKRGANLGTLQLTCADDHARGAFTWPGQAGLYRLRARFGGQDATEAVVATASATPNAEGARLLCTGTPITVNGPVKARVPPLDCLETQLVAVVADMERVPRDRLDFTSSVVIEGEAFTAEGGGAIKKSREHQNTHGGGCVFSWANASHWIEWSATVPKAGRYLLTIIAATTETQAIRSLTIDGKPVVGAALTTFTNTGGWGRSTPTDWQAFRPVKADGTPVGVELSEGLHSLRMDNLLGQHLNIDVILLTPQP
ncbi:MAG: hypothetical protein HN742_23910 [Lentisphaerae bacterium]|jgi:hypothetical protein|nr:hypothetical protein [Lentisphaerota bacterium]MBT4821076.1 hypothetical protein [Lentisphaerota bacterium]MBT5612784.1 hypothetical protein [Lentisphaerota bacterium]MBT7057610.1 hypothetical protein [Lentisphaerota bacterium]MBT7844943.1 hypothetical protein [Lentisphaerota bacterium]